jgi:DNA-binding NarL/FixJ family response regulator
VTALVERHGNTAPGPQSVRAPRFTAMVVVASPFVRETLARTLRSLGAAEVVEASSLAEARTRALGTTSRDLAVVDSSLPDGSGIALVRELRGLGWVRGMVLSSTEDPYTVRAALAGGVRAFLVTASSGGPAARASSLPHTLAARPRAARLTGAEALSGREVEVLQLVADGRSNKEIGEALGLSALTVKSHLARIARKLGTGDRAEMVVVAMRAGVVV